MKKKVVMLLTCLMLVSLGACGDEESGGEKDVQVNEAVLTTSGEEMGDTVAVGDGEVSDSGTEDEVSSGTEEETQKPDQEGLGFRGEVDYRGINEAGTDMDKLAFLAGDTVHIFDFGEDCNMVDELAMSNRGLITSVEEDVQLYFSSGASSREKDADFALYRDGIHAAFGEMEREGELSVWDDEVIVASEDGSFQYVASTMLDGFYDVAMTPEGGSFPVVVKLSLVDSLDVLYSTVEWMKTNYKCYKLVTYEDINSAVDIDGNWIDLSDCVFYEDILAKGLKEHFGIVIRDYAVFEDGNGSDYEFQLDTEIEASFSASLYSLGFTEEDAIDFLGYKAYVIPGREIYLQYNFNEWSIDAGDIIRFKINPKETLTTEEETLAYLEERLFSDKMFEAE